MCPGVYCAKRRFPRLSAMSKLVHKQTDPIAKRAPLMTLRRRMSALEKWQIFNGAVANILLLGTIIVAAYIGLKQIACEAKGIGFRQLRNWLYWAFIQELSQICCDSDERSPCVAK